MFMELQEKMLKREVIDYIHENQLLGTLGLPVSPALKLTDKGLVDVKNSTVVDLIVQ